jgi:hypothetical protein
VENSLSLAVSGSSFSGAPAVTSIRVYLVVQPATSPRCNALLLLVLVPVLLLLLLLLLLLSPAFSLLTVPLPSQDIINN